MAEKKTIWQKLTTVLNSEVNPMAIDKNSQDLLDLDGSKPLNGGKGGLITATSQEELNLKKLTAQQTKYLGDQYKVINKDIYQKSVYYETTRYGSYIDFEAMEYTPEVSSALDIMAEEATCLNDKGTMLEVRSNSDRVKKILEHLFNSILDVNSNLYAWTRNTLKYGDDFLMLKSEPEKGITQAIQLKNFEIKRIDGDPITGEGDIKFEWKVGNVEFNNWQIAHFRLLGDDKKMPYGTCLKYNTRIKTNDGFKEIKDIKKGDLVYSFDLNSENQVLSKVLDTVNSGKKQCYKISTRHNFIEASEEHKILTFSHENNEFIYKNTLDLKINDFLVIDKKTNNNELIKIDKTKPVKNKNGHWHTIDAVPDYITEDFAQLFGFILGDGWLISSNGTIGIAYGPHEEINKTYKNLLEKFSNNKVIDSFSYKTYRIGQGNCSSKMLKTILERMGMLKGASNKRIPTWVYNSSIDIRKALLKGLIDADGSLFIDKWNCLRYTIELANEELIHDVKVLVQSLGYKSGKVCKRKAKRVSKFTNENGIERTITGKHDCYYLYFFESENKQALRLDNINRKSNEYILEKINKIEVTDKVETYDIYVENENHNFYANGIVVHNSVLEKARKIWKMLCLDSNSKVATSDGFTLIKDIKIDDEILSYDYKNNKIIISKVKNIFNTGKKDTYKVKTLTKEIILTDEHPILTLRDEKYDYKDIDDININYDSLVTFENNKIELEKIESITLHQENADVWDIEIDNNLRNFIADGIVVHNCLAEDAMMVYRISRAAERRVFKIDVGNIDPDDVENYVQKVASKFKKTTQVNQNNGQIDLRYNTLTQDEDYFIPVRNNQNSTIIDTLPGACLSLDTEIPLLDGRTLKLSEIINEWDNGDGNLWAYSCNPQNGEQTKGLITWAGVTRKDTEVLKITLDNDKEIIATPDHKFLSSDGEFIEAQYLNVNDSLMSFNKNNIIYKISKIERLTEKIDTGTLTIDGDEVYHNYHTFALACGIYVKNSNLSDIDDISFLHNKLFAALRVPKSFLGFDETVGDGKTLSMMDIRFGRTINRIQQAMIMELNKIAIIHLYLLGFEEEWNNFSLALANPSSQAEMLKMEIMGTKLDNYIKAVADAGNGFGAYSMTKAKKDILGMSEDEIVLDLEQQRLEKAEAIRNSPEVLGSKNLNSGLFDNLDKRYTDNGESQDNGLEGQTPPNPEAGGELPLGGAGGGLPTGGLPDLNEPVGGVESPAPGGLPPEPSGGGNVPELKEMDFYVGNKSHLMESLKKNFDKVNKLLGE